jgi:hypothetical protein
MHDTLAKCIIAFKSGLSDCHRPEDRSFISTYLAALAPVLAKATIGKNVLEELQQIERLFGNSWVIDVQPFHTAFDYWRKFKNEYERFSLAGMTVNERLCTLGLMSDFDSAVSSGDKTRMRFILERAFLDEMSIQKIIEANPRSHRGSASLGGAS